MIKTAKFYRILFLPEVRWTTTPDLYCNHSKKFPGEIISLFLGCIKTEYAICIAFHLQGFYLDNVFRQISCVPIMTAVPFQPHV